MSTDTQQVVSKAWNFAHVLWVDGSSYMAYVEQIAFLLSLKMERTGPPTFWQPGNLGGTFRPRWHLSPLKLKPG